MSLYSTPRKETGNQQPPAQNPTHDEENNYHIGEEIANAVTHAVGGYLGAAAVVLLVVFAIWSDEQVVWKIVSGSIFGATIIILYSASTVYHAVTNVQVKEICRACDQMAIYALIAGTYTPFCLVTLRQTNLGLAWTVFGIVWGLTVLGIMFKVLIKHQFKYITTITYLLMGWCCLLIIRPLYYSLELGGILWLVLGGILYSLGVVFFLWQKLPFNHTIWHIFVLAGTACHFFCILYYVMS
ncbi:MAG: hemolysin III family protein [Planctomycetaceae bacterium]|jgi:hemolysin III|nr:hemolysin III family protein [Planctomycetaceae bacterium]